MNFGIILVISSMYLIALLFTLIYFYYKTKGGIQAFQQSAYDPKRYIQYMKENYKYSFGINELLPIFFAVVLSFNYEIIRLFLIIFFLYYNIKFFNLAKGRYKEKLPLKFTPRVKRQIVTLTILIILILVVLLKLGLGLIVGLLMIVYFIYPLITIMSYINLPLEKYFQQQFKNRAERKLKKHNNLLVIGITGSYGKTSIKNIVYDILKEEEVTLITPNSFNTPMGLSMTINNDLTALYQNFIAEMGAYYKGEIHELTEIVHPQIGIVSSIGPQHLETFKTIENIQATKMELIESLPRDGLAILNYDNKYIREYKIKNDVLVKYYSLEDSSVDLYAYNIEYLTTGMRFKIKFKEKEYEIESKLLGKYNIYNILAGILVADYKGLKIEKILKSIGKIEPIKNRMELKRITNSLSIIDDSFNGNVEGMIEDITILKTYKAKKKMITPGIIDGGEQNYELNKKIALEINDEIDELYIVGSYNRDVYTSYAKIEKEKIYLFDNFLDAYARATNDKNPIVVLIANDLPDKYNK